MRKYLYSLLILTFTGCGGNSFESFRAQGEGVSRSLLKELQKIRTHEELLAAKGELTRLFSELVQVMQRAKSYQMQHLKEEPPAFTEFNHALSDQLCQEMNRLYGLEGGREIIERYQREALKKVN